MNRKQVFIILVATLFLAVSIVGAQAATTVKSSKSNASFRDASSTSDPGNPSPSDATTVKSSKSNSSDRAKGQDPQVTGTNEKRINKLHK